MAGVKNGDNNCLCGMCSGRGISKARSSQHIQGPETINEKREFLALMTDKDEESKLIGCVGDGNYLGEQKGQVKGE